MSLLSPDVNYEELARCTDDFNGAQCKAVCVEAVSGGGVRGWLQTLSLHWTGWGVWLVETAEGKGLRRPRPLGAGLKMWGGP